MNIKSEESLINKGKDFLLDDDKQKDIKNFEKKHKVDTSSIIARAKNSVLQFPVYVPRTSTRLHTMHIISKMLEKVYATFVQSVMSQQPIISEKEANNLLFLKDYHSNIQESVEIYMNEYYEPIDDFDKMMGESVFNSFKINDNIYVEFKAIPTTNKYLIAESTRLSNEPLKGFSYLIEAEEKKDITKVNKKVTRERNEPDRIIKDSELIDLATDKAKENKSYAKEVQNDDGEIDINKVKKGIQSGDIFKIDGVQIEYNSNKEKFIIVGKPGGTTETQITTKTTPDKPEPPEHDRGVDAPKILKDSEINKINGMAPYSIEVAFHVKNEDKSSRIIRFVLGVKTILHRINPKDLAEDLREIISGDINALQNVRYKTGEITFWDKWFNISSIKSSVAKGIDNNKRWISNLRRLAQYKKTHGTLAASLIKSLNKGNLPIPNATLILTHVNVLDIHNSTGIDLNIISNVRKLANSLYLMAFIIVDDNEGTMKIFFPDSDSNWDIQSMASVEAELNKTDRSPLKNELNRLVNK